MPASDEDNWHLAQVTHLTFIKNLRFVQFFNQEYFYVVVIYEELYTFINFISLRKKCKTTRNDMSVPPKP